MDSVQMLRDTWFPFGRLWYLNKGDKLGWMRRLTREGEILVSLYKDKIHSLKLDEAKGRVDIPCIQYHKKNSLQMSV